MVITFSCLVFPQIPGLVNVDFADVSAIMTNAGSSLMGIGTATGNFKRLLVFGCVDKCLPFACGFFSPRIVPCISGFIPAYLYLLCVSKF